MIEKENNPLFDQNNNFIRPAIYNVGKEGGIVVHREVFCEEEYFEYREKIDRGLHKTQKPDPLISEDIILTPLESIEDISPHLEQRRKIAQHLEAWRILEDGKMIDVTSENPLNEDSSHQESFFPQR